MRDTIKYQHKQKEKGVTMRNKFIKLMKSIKEHINNDPYVSDVQVQQYRRMLKLNLKEQDEVLCNLTEQAIIQAKRNQNGG